MITDLFKLMIGLSIPNQKKSRWKTFVVNFRLFGVKGIFVQPIEIYCNTKIYSIGKINIHCPLSKGILTIGKLDIKSQGCTKFANYGVIDVHGPSKIEGCCNFINKGVVIFRGNNRISDGCLINIRKSLEIGECTDIGFQSVVMDTDDHFTFDINSETIENVSKGIILGRNNFIGCRTTIKKGTVTPDYLVVASANTLLSKDYSSLPPYSVLGGIPAKLLKSGICRIFNRKYEVKLFELFTDKDDLYKVTKEEIDVKNIETLLNRDLNIF